MLPQNAILKLESLPLPGSPSAPQVLLVAPRCACVRDLRPGFVLAEIDLVRQRIAFGRQHLGKVLQALHLFLLSGDTSPAGHERRHALHGVCLYLAATVQSTRTHSPSTPSPIGLAQVSGAVQSAVVTCHCEVVVDVGLLFAALLPALSLARGGPGRYLRAPSGQVSRSRMRAKGSDRPGQPHIAGSQAQATRLITSAAQMISPHALPPRRATYSGVAN